MDQQVLVLDDSVETELAHAEARIERASRDAFRDIGLELKHIRDRKLWQAHYPSFLIYCDERWEWSEKHVNRLIFAADTYDFLQSKLEPMGSLLPCKERHIRPLRLLDNDAHKAEVWQRVVSNPDGRVTVKVVEAEVQRKLAELEKSWITLAEWNEMDETERAACLTQIRYSDKTMNKPSDSIEWAMWSWNPVTGCLNNCGYCYARDIAHRFYPQKFVPSFVPDRLPAPANTKLPAPRWTGDIGYKGVFVCSMADLFGEWVPVEWIEAVLEAIESNPQWEFLLLTKFPVRMADFEYPSNVWLGATVDKQNAVERAESAFRKIRDSSFEGICWLSCEPMLERLTFSSLDLFNWIVMGGASRSSQTPEHKPPFDDIVHLHNQARDNGLLIYQKTNLMPGISNEQRIREYPTQSRGNNGENEQ